MKLHRMLLAVATLTLVGALAGEAQAQGFEGRTGLPWFGYGYSGSLYGLGRLPVPPYFSIHPPVYYSLPRARTYGQSPFAYSGDYRRPERVAPRFVRNPYVEVMPAAPTPAPIEELIEEPTENPAGAPVDDGGSTATSTARLIINPFYRSVAMTE